MTLPSAQGASCTWQQPARMCTRACYVSSITPFMPWHLPIPPAGSFGWWTGERHSTCMQQRAPSHMCHTPRGMPPWPWVTRSRCQAVCFFLLPTTVMVEKEDVFKALTQARHQALTQARHQALTQARHQALTQARHQARPTPADISCSVAAGPREE